MILDEIVRTADLSFQFKTKMKDQPYHALHSLIYTNRIICEKDHANFILLFK